MYYKFDTLSGRLSTSSQTTSFSPQGFQTLEVKVQPQKYDFSSTNPVKVKEARNMSSQSLKEAPKNFIGRVPTDPAYIEFRKKQKKLFHMDYMQDKSPHQFFKSDRMINRAVTGVILAGLCLTVMSYGPKYWRK